MIRNAAPADHAALLALWQANAPRQGYASRPDAEVDRLLFRHPYFSYEYTFVREEQGRAVAFICGCVGNDIPHGRERGCFTCLAADPAWDIGLRHHQLNLCCTVKTTALFLHNLQD